MPLNAPDPRVGGPRTHRPARGGLGPRRSRVLVPAALGCPKGYSYAGLYSPTKANGIAATISMLDTPAAVGGSNHVAGWIGVGGPGLGPHGADEWLQVGLATFGDSNEGRLYYELAQPGHAPEYVELATGIVPGIKVRVAVMELQFARDAWIVVSPAGIGPVLPPTEPSGLGTGGGLRELCRDEAVQPLLVPIRRPAARARRRQLADDAPGRDAAGSRLEVASPRCLRVQRHRGLSGATLPTAATARCGVV